MKNINLKLDKNSLLLPLLILLAITISTTCWAKHDSFYKEYKPKTLLVPYNYSLAGDQKMSSRAGAHLSFSLIEAYRAIENKSFPDNSNSILGTLTKQLWRLLATAEILIVQHEIFGHGSKIREFGFDGSYHIGFLQGSAGIKDMEMDDISPRKLAIISIGGVEGTHVLAEKIKKRFFEINGTILPIHGASYFLNQTDKFTYSFTEFKGEGHDILLYLKKMNEMYGANFLTKNKIRKFALMDLADPFIYFSLYSFAADKNFKIPMFKIKGIKYLPALRSIFTPYGLETKLVNHFVLKNGNTYGQINFVYGNNHQNSYAIEANMYNIIKINKISFGLEFSLWRQPELFTDTPLHAQNKLGAMINLISECSFTDSFKAFVELGYKTAGYKSGFPIKKTPLVQLGISLAI